MGAGHLEKQEVLAIYSTALAHSVGDYRVRVSISTFDNRAPKLSRTRVSGVTGNSEIVFGLLVIFPFTGA